jgi:hypothetical protein
VLETERRWLIVSADDLATVALPLPSYRSSADLVGLTVDAKPAVSIVRHRDFAGPAVKAAVAGRPLLLLQSLLLLLLSLSLLLLPLLLLPLLPLLSLQLLLLSLLCGALIGA